MNELSSVFSSSGLEDAFRIIELQERLLTITETTIIDTFAYIIDLPIINQDNGIRRIVDNIDLTAEHRPELIPTLVSLTKLLIQEPKLADYKKTLLYPFTLKGVFRRSHLLFLNHCLLKEVVDPQEVIVLIRDFIQFTPNKNYTNTLLFFWFAPWIENIDPILFEEIFNHITTYHDSEFDKLVQKFDELRANDWALLHQLHMTGYFKDSIESIIINDDINTLQTWAVRPGFDKQQRIKPSNFECREYARHQPTLLEFASLYGSKECFHFLLLSSDLHASNSVTITSNAIAGGNLDIIKTCEIRGFDFSDTLQTATEFHRYDLFLWLYHTLCSKIDVKNKLTSIFNVSAKSNNVKNLIFCVENGLDVNNRDQNNCTPLHFAASINEVDTLKVLLSAHNINVNATDDDGFTPLHKAIRSGNCAGIRILLEQSGIDVNITTKRTNQTPLLEAAEHGNSNVIQLLLDHKDVDLTARDSKQLTALHKATLGNSTDIIQLLLENDKFDINAADTYGYTPLHYAALYGFIDTLKLLLMYDSVNASAKDVFFIFKMSAFFFILSDSC